MILGALMNTRGLMQLVVVNIGLDLGILSPEIFAMMVVMALVTTFMTGPLLNLIDKVFKDKTVEKESSAELYKILISFDDSRIGEKLLLIANSFVRKTQNSSQVNMVHLSPGNNLYQHDMEEEEEDKFEPILRKSEELNQPVTPIFEVASNPYSRTVKIVNNGNYKLLLLGAQDSIYEGNLLGQFLGLSNRILHYPSRIISWITRNRKSSSGSSLLDQGLRSVVMKSDVPVGIFIDKGLKEIRNVLVPVLDENDVFIGTFMERLAKNSYVRITLWDAAGLMDSSMDFVKSIREIKGVNPYLFQLWNNNIAIDKDIFNKHDLILVSLKSWKKLKEKHPSWIRTIPSTLLLND
ncbi:MAG TPA: hypothetical protein DIT04_06815 [Dysgonomonas sp.]|nr:hypothetical protein [Dysgonomonas sp.]